MSPETYRKEGFKYIIHYEDHELAHVHVNKDGKEVRVYLYNEGHTDPTKKTLVVESRSKKKFKTQELAKIKKEVLNNRAVHLNNWYEAKAKKR